jgi:hypothetical protein
MNIVVPMKITTQEVGLSTYDLKYLRYTVETSVLGEVDP